MFGVVVICDAVYLGWASYATAGLTTPLQALLLLQLVTVSLLASFRTGVKLALLDSLLLLCALYARQAGVLHFLGGHHLRFDNGDAHVVYAQVVVYWLAALVTASFAAVNERELRRRRYDLEALALFARHLEELHDSSAIADQVLADVHDAFGYGRSMMIEVDETSARCLATRELDAAAEIGWPLSRGELSEHSPRLWQALDSGTTELVRTRDRQSDPVLSCFGDERRVIVVPLRADGRSIGALVTEHTARAGSRVERRVVSMLESFASHAALAVGNANLLAEIRALATIDQLTGLPNRRLLDEALARECAESLRSGEPLGVLMIDVDRFKSHNDTYGHQSGDAVLRAVGEALRGHVRAMDVAARYGGEEFCIVMPGADLETAAAAGERLRQSIARIVVEHPVTASVGVACSPAHGRTPIDLTNAADAALYAAKRGGRNRVCVADAQAGATPAIDGQQDAGLD